MNNLEEIEIKTVRELDILVRGVRSSVDKGFERMHGEMQTISADLKHLQSGRIASLEKNVAEMSTGFALISERVIDMKKIIWGVIGFIMITAGGLITWKLTGR